MRRFNRKKKPKHTTTPRYARTWDLWEPIYTGPRDSKRASFVETLASGVEHITYCYKKTKRGLISKEREKKRTKRKEKERYNIK